MGLRAPHIAAAATILRAPPESSVVRRRHGGLDVEVRLEDDHLWVIMRREEMGGLALRMPVFSPDARCVSLDEAGMLAVVECSGSLGTSRLRLCGDRCGIEQLRATLEFTPADDLTIGSLSRDLVPFDANGDPLGTEGQIEAEQRKFNTGLLYFTLKQPDFGKILYVQNFTVLNDYFNATGSKPDAAVGGEWPDLGYCPPVNPDTHKAVLPGGRTLTLYDTIVSVRGYPQKAEDDSAWQFLDMLAGAYSWLSPPKLEFRDWHDRAERTIHDLMQAPEARIEHYGRDYFHPYTACEYPDAMVQLSIASAIAEWGQWRGIRHPLLRQIVDGLDRFYDPELRTLRRYLPNVGPDKDPDQVDSWYLYHPLLNIANLALLGDAKTRELFLASLDYGIRAARHFDYKWPIFFNIRDFSIIKEVADADQRGQTDVGGIYAWVMLQAFELTRENRFLEEAIRSIEAAKGMRFHLNYQANLTAWGAAACIRLWRITNQKQYLTQSYVYLASFFHNSQMWESEIGLAKHSRNFLGVTCLQDAPYMAAYECFDSFAAFERYLDYGGPDLISAVKLLVTDYCRHALDRAWYYYPDALPPEAVAEKPRNGYIKRELSFPLEDLYPDGQQAGQVGQEVYGSGAAMVFCSRAFHRIGNAPFLLFCDHFIRAIHRFDGHTISMKIDGHEGALARVALVPLGDAEMPGTRLWTFGNRPLPLKTVNGRVEAWAPPNVGLTLAWEEQ